MKKLGAIIARFQVPTLHKGHIALLKEAADKTDRLIIFLGYKVNQPDIKNPYSFEVRKAMVEQVLKEYGLDHKVIIDKMEDHPISNEQWSQELDKKIESHSEVFQKEVKDPIIVTLYGSRDSFIKYYFGQHATEVIEEMYSVSGTEMRQKVLNLSPLDLTNHHREGMVYAFKHIYPVGMSVVDVAVFKKDKEDLHILLGRKKREDQYRLIGGFFDVDLDNSLEDAALRELKEEAGDIQVGDPKYVSSKKIHDWRYYDNQHKIVSSLFMVEFISGKPIPSDDIEELVWVDVKHSNAYTLVPSHQEFIELAVNSFENK